MTSQGGDNGMGTIFKIKKNGTGFQKLFDFNWANSGASPRGTLTMEGDLLYVMTMSSATNGFGAIFKIGRNGTGFKKLLDFDGVNNGAFSMGSLTLVDSTIYGMTSLGGSRNYGTFFKINPGDGSYTKLKDFFIMPENGAYPGSLFTDGSYLIGTTSEGGINGLGLIFKTNMDGTGYRKLFDFDSTTGRGSPSTEY